MSVGEPRYYDRTGRPIDLLEWMSKFEDKEYQLLEATEVCSGVLASTVWLGLDHSWVPETIEIFETMVFVDLDEPREVLGLRFTRDGAECHRWATEAEALAGHRSLVTELRNTIGQLDEIGQLERPEPG